MAGNDAYCLHESVSMVIKNVSQSSMRSSITNLYLASGRVGIYF